MSAYWQVGQVSAVWPSGLISSKACRVGGELANFSDSEGDSALIVENSKEPRASVKPATCASLSGVDFQPSDADLIAEVRRGDVERFGELVTRYQSKIFATARRHARREEEVEDIVQEVFLKAFHHLGGFRGDAPFEHWLMRLAIHTCYDFLRRHQRNREHSMTDLSDDERDWLETQSLESAPPGDDVEAAKTLIDKVLAQLSASNRLIITLLEIEDRSVKEVAELTGWSVTLVKVRAFRARIEMRRILQRMTTKKYL